MTNAAVTIAAIVWSTIGMMRLVAILASSGRDNTDRRVHWFWIFKRTRRSGLILRTDHGTGVQYLETVSGHITPRLDRDGKPVCQED